MRFILMLLLFIPATLYSQHKGYGSVGGTFTPSAAGTSKGVTVGVGFGTNVTMGAGIDIYPSSVATMIQPYADIRAFFLGMNKPVEPYVAIQPGMAVVDGEKFFAFNGLLGLMARPKKIGVFISGGIAHYRVVEGSGLGVKFSVGLAF